MNRFQTRLVLLLLMVSGQAVAALGGDAASIEADRAQMRASLRAIPGARYAVHEIQLPSGTVIHEYLSPNGQVFGVAWQGPFMPDLSQLLGPSYTIYQEEANKRQNRRGPFAVDHPALVARSGGHMRFFKGLAYIPQLLPSGVSVDEIK
jgi:hypothetical protein